MTALRPPDAARPLASPSSARPRDWPLWILLVASGATLMAPFVASVLDAIVHSWGLPLGTVQSQAGRIVMVVMILLVGGGALLAGLRMLRGRRDASRVLPGVVAGVGAMCLLSAVISVGYMLVSAAVSFLRFGL